MLEEEKKKRDRREKMELELAEQASETTGSMKFHNLVIMKAELQRMKERKNTYEGEKWALVEKGVCAEYLEWKDNQIKEIKQDISTQIADIATYQYDVQRASRPIARGGGTVAAANASSGSAVDTDRRA